MAIEYYDYEKKDQNFLKEFVLWGLVELKKISKERYTAGYAFTDNLGSYLGNIES